MTRNKYFLDSFILFSALLILCRIPMDLNCLRSVECISGVVTRSNHLRSAVSYQILLACFDHKVACVCFPLFHMFRSCWEIISTYSLCGDFYHYMHLQVSSSLCVLPQSASCWLNYLLPVISVLPLNFSWLNA